MEKPLDQELLRKMDAFWRAANYLSVGQIYLYDNPLLAEPLALEDVKPRLLGHWGTTPGQNFIYVHLNRIIKQYDLNMIYISGPGHAGPALVANTYLEGTYSELYPNITQDAAGLKRLFKQFSFPGGIPSHVAPETPGSIHEGGELGYSLSHAFGAAFDNPDLIVAAVVGDGEAETGPLATSWHGNKFLDAAHDGAVLPILHLNGYKIANPTVLARIGREELEELIDSMFNQHAKWLKVTRHIPWRRPIASLNILLASHVWRQDHNGFTHQDPGFIDHVCNKKAEIIRVYLPPDTNTLLSVADHCLKSRHYVNVIVASKHPSPQWLDMDAALKHCTGGIGIWEWASNDRGSEPDVVMACAGDVPTLETLAAVQMLREHVPDLKIRVVNVVDLMRLQPATEHPHGLSDLDFDTLFTKDKPVIFAYHGYPWLIHRLTYRRTNHKNLHVRGYKEEGTISTPFDMAVMNDLDRFHLVGDVVDRVPETVQDGRLRQASDPRQADRAPAIHHHVRRRHAGDPRLEWGVARRSEPGR